MRKTISVLLVLVAISIGFSSYASDTSDIRLNNSSYSISVIKVLHEKNEESTYAFKYCIPGQDITTCNAIGSPEGYTREEITGLNGVWTQIKAFGVGAGDLVGGAVVGAWVGTLVGTSSIAWLGTGVLGTTTGIVGGATAGLSVPVAAINFIDAINPFLIYEKGSAERTVERNVKDLIATGEASVVIYSNTDPVPVLKLADQIEGVLRSLTNVRDRYAMPL